MLFGNDKVIVKFNPT